MPILDNEPCRYCGMDNGFHALTCDFGIAEVVARHNGHKQARYEMQTILTELRGEVMRGNIRSAIGVVVWLESNFARE